MQEDEEEREFAAKTRKVRGEDSRDGVRERKEKQLDKDGK